MKTVERHGFANPRQRQMRRVVAFFDRHAELGHGLFRSPRQGAQGFAALDTGPENARTAWVREPAEALDSDIDGAANWHGGQRALHFIQALFRPLADELSGDVQVIEGTPADLGRRPQAAHEGTQGLGQVGGDIDRGEQSHAKLTSVVCGVLW